MANNDVIQRIHAALDRYYCHKHELRHSGVACQWCALDSVMGRTHRTVSQIMRGVMVPSWERERL